MYKQKHRTQSLIRYKSVWVDFRSGLKRRVRTMTASSHSAGRTLGSSWTERHRKTRTTTIRQSQ